MRSGDLIILNSSHGVLVGMVIKLSGPVEHTNHVCGPELYPLILTLPCRVIFSMIERLVCNPEPSGLATFSIELNGEIFEVQNA